MFEQLRILFLEHPNPILYALPYFAFMVLSELYINYKDRRDLYVAEDSVASVAMGFISAFIDIFTKAFYFLIMLWLYQYALFADTLYFTWWAWLLFFFTDDFSFYWHHRTSHLVRVFWASHVAHHSSEKYNLSTALRQSWTEITYKYLFYLWLPLIGFHPIMVITMMAISLIYQFGIHTQMIKKLPWVIELVMNTPSHHRVHHGSNVVYLDKNYGGILIIWDRIFGTFKAEIDSEPVIYGITNNIKTHNLLHIATHEFTDLANDIKRAPNFKTRIKYLFMPPGWHHNKPVKTAEALQKANDKL